MGFRVPVQSERLCFDLLRVGTFRANHLTPRGFDFSIGRQQLLVNDASRRFSREITTLIHDAYRAFLTKSNVFNPRTIFELNEQSAMHGGNVFDTYTGSELADAHRHYPDLLCFRLVEVDPSKSFAEAQVRYVNLQELSDMTGIVLVLQNSPALRVAGLIDRPYMEPEAFREIVYEYAKTSLKNHYQAGFTFVADPNRASSMLFDGDPDGSVVFISGLMGSDVRFDACIQRLDLSRIRRNSHSEGVIAEVRGRWTGTIYLREFEAPQRKPYVFLGRHRVLIRRNSQLEVQVKQLTAAGRFVKLADQPF